jgi:hypothetical protein
MFAEFLVVVEDDRAVPLLTGSWLILLSAGLTDCCEPPLVETDLRESTDAGVVPEKSLLLFSEFLPLEI